MHQDDDIPGIVRYRTYEVLKNEVNNPRLRWAYLPYSMHMAGPREAIQHIIIRKNYGAILRNDCSSTSCPMLITAAHCVCAQGVLAKGCMALGACWGFIAWYQSLNRDACWGGSEHHPLDASSPARGAGKSSMVQQHCVRRRSMPLLHCRRALALHATARSLSCHIAQPQLGLAVSNSIWGRVYLFLVAAMLVCRRPC